MTTEQKDPLQSRPHDQTPSKQSDAGKPVGRVAAEGKPGAGTPKEGKAAAGTPKEGRPADGKDNRDKDTKNGRDNKDGKADGQSADDATPSGGQTADEADQRPTGTALLETALTRASEAMTSEYALASANLVFQINNVPAVSGATLRKTNVGTEALRTVRRTFVPPPGLDAAWRTLAEHRLLLLHGSPGDGREYLATFLLDAFCDARVRRFDNGSLASLAEADLTSGGGHLWAGRLGDRLELRVLETLAGWLSRIDGYLIVRWPDDREREPELGRYAETADRPDLKKVIERHLDSAAKAQLTDPRVVEMCGKLSGAHQAARLAEVLGDVAAGRKSLEEALDEVSALERGIADWFSDLPEREDQAFAIALTALNGLSLPSVVAGARLADELIQRAEDPRGRYGLRPFRRPTRALLTSVGAECVRSIRKTGYGPVPIKSVQLRRDQGDARKLLDAIWESFPYLQEIYFEWIRLLANDQDPYVRIRVAWVAGMLAAHDFEFVRGRLLFGWAADSDKATRRVAATALRPLARDSDSDLQDIVWRLLESWAGLESASTKAELHHRLTAATALGGPVGETDPERALDMITRHLLSHSGSATDYDVWTATAFAVGELFGDGASSTSDAVLRRASEWAETKEIGAVNVAGGVLLNLAGKPPDSATSAGRPVPPLLRATGREPGNVEHAAVLWRQAIRRPNRGLVTAALNGLRILADNAAGGADDELVAMVTAIPRTDRERRTLAYETRCWMRDDQHPAISARLHELLS